MRKKENDEKKEKMGHGPRKKKRKKLGAILAKPEEIEKKKLIWAVDLVKPVD